MWKAEDIRKESVSELESKLDGLRKKHMELRFRHATGTLKNPLEMKVLKRDIARVISIIKEKENEG